jgi:hypothetical protein
MCRISSPVKAKRVAAISLHAMVDNSANAAADVSIVEAHRNTFAATYKCANSTTHGEIPVNAERESDILHAYAYDLGTSSVYPYTLTITLKWQA